MCLLKSFHYITRFATFSFWVTINLGLEEFISNWTIIKLVIFFLFSFIEAYINSRSRYYLKRRCFSIMKREILYACVSFNLMILVIIKSLQLLIIPSIGTIMQNQLFMFVSMEEVKSVIFSTYSYDAWFSANIFQNLFTHC